MRENNEADCENERFNSQEISRFENW